MLKVFLFNNPYKQDLMKEGDYLGFFEIEEEKKL